MQQRVDIEMRHSKILTVWEKPRYVGAIHLFERQRERVVVPLNKVIKDHPDIKFLEYVRFETWAAGMWHQGLTDFIYDYWNPQFHTTHKFARQETRKWLLETFDDVEFQLSANGHGQSQINYGVLWWNYFQKYYVAGVSSGGHFHTLQSPFEDEITNTDAFKITRVSDRNGKPRLKFVRR